LFSRRADTITTLQGVKHGPDRGPEEKPLQIVEEVIEGADAIASFLFGDSTKRRRVSYLAEKTRIPIFRLGSTLCLRPSAYRHFIESQEARAMPNVKKSN
jgi:hypothetical protein